MDMDVEINLKIPNIKNAALDENGYPIDSGSIRFTKTIRVPAVPKPGQVLPLSTSSGQTFECEVIGANWHEERELFVVYCKYAKRSIPQDHYDALMRSADWRMKPLL